MPFPKKELNGVSEIHVFTWTRRASTLFSMTTSLRAKKVLFTDLRFQGHAFFELILPPLQSAQTLPQLVGRSPRQKPEPAEVDAQNGFLCGSDQFGRPEYGAVSTQGNHNIRVAGEVGGRAERDLVGDTDLP